MKQQNRHHVILNLLEHEGPLTTRALSAKCGIDQTTLGRDLGSLVDAGVILRTENTGWRRQGAKVGRYTYHIEDQP